VYYIYDLLTLNVKFQLNTGYANFKTGQELEKFRKSSNLTLDKAYKSVVQKVPTLHWTRKLRFNEIRI